jgi:NAD(P) transhydrogenase subunit beta
MITFIINLAYLIGAVAFVWGLRLLGSPDTARKGNAYAAAGMGIAIIATLFIPLEKGNNNYLWILAGMIGGGAIGWLTAKKVKMTDMPQLVSIFNGLGGACAVVLALAELNQFYEGARGMSGGEVLIVLLALLIGGVAFTGSILAYAKLQGLVKDKHVTLPKHQFINLILLAVVLVFGAVLYFMGASGTLVLVLIFTLVTLIYGLSFVAPIGGADMPVVISLLNSFTGLSAAAAGLVYGNQIMLVGGILVGASGTILTVLMCEAMNRSLLNVVIGGFGTAGPAKTSASGDQIVKEISINDLAIQLYYSQSVMFVPGYGLAVAQAQKVVKEVDDILEANGVDVKYAIHPVAGRMPGHMNVLLAEADVPYPKLLDLEDANNALPNTDIVVIVGANDVVNPAAEDDPGSPIYGMPVLQVWNAKNTVVIKRSMSPGYAGIENPLFFHQKNKMLFGDAKVKLQEVIKGLKEM